MFKTFVFVLAISACFQPTLAGGCLDPQGSPCACAGVPSDGHFFLTSFGGTSCACGECGKYGMFFSASKQRFGCGAHLNVCKDWAVDQDRAKSPFATCLKLTVVDYGPSCFVDNDAGGSVLDASTAVCKYITGGTSCGWSDHFKIQVTRAAAPEIDGIPLGPFNMTWAQYDELVKVELM